jgi:hypothetical protein
VYGRNVVVSFADNNHWAYAEQIRKSRMQNWYGQVTIIL